MSRWKSAYDSQHVTQSAQNVLTALESITLEGMSEENLAEYFRLLKILKVLATRLAKLDPELLALNSWSTFSNHLNQARSEIIAFGQNRNVSHLHNANSNVDQVVTVLKPFDTGSVVEEFKSVADANAVFQEKLLDELERVRARGEEIHKQLDSLSDAVVQGKVRLEENNQIIQQQKARLDQSIAEFQKQFSDAQEKRTNDFADALKANSHDFSQQGEAFEVEFSQDAARRKQEYENFFEVARQQSDDHLKFIQRRQDEVDKIFGAIGTTAFAGNFKTTADAEADAANLLRWIALGLMAAMILLGGYAFYYSIGGSR